MYGIFPYIIMMSVFIAWRYSVYSDIFPNTYYAKMGTSFETILIGLKYAMVSIASLLGPMFILLPVSLISKRPLTDPYWLFLGLTVVNAVFGVYAGTDWMPGFRLLLPMLPMMIIVCLFNIDLILTNTHFSAEKINYRPIVIISTVLFIAAGVLGVSRTMIRGQAPFLVSGFNSVTGFVKTEHLTVAKWIKNNTKPGDLVAIGEAGLIGYLNPEMRLLDVHGLMDKKIAQDRKHRRPFDVDYIFLRAPDYFILHKDLSKSWEAIIGHVDVYEAIHNDPRFDEWYEIKATFKNFVIYQRKNTND